MATTVIYPDNSVWVLDPDQVARLTEIVESDEPYEVREARGLAELYRAQRFHLGLMRRVYEEAHGAAT